MRKISQTSSLRLTGEIGKTSNTFAGKVERLPIARRARPGGRMGAEGKKRRLGGAPSGVTPDELPSNKASVLQLTSITGELLETFAGRVEHLPAARPIRSGEMKELLAALSRRLEETGSR